MSESGTKQSRLDAFDKKLNEELALWHKHGIDPSGVVINGFLLDAQVNTLIEFLIEKEIIDRLDVDLKYKETVLQRLRQLRPNIIRNKIAAGAQPRLIDKNGKPLL